MPFRSTSFCTAGDDRFIVDTAGGCVEAASFWSADDGRCLRYVDRQFFNGERCVHYDDHGDNVP